MSLTAGQVTYWHERKYVRLELKSTENSERRKIGKINSSGNSNL